MRNQPGSRQAVSVMLPVPFSTRDGDSPHDKRSGRCSWLSKPGKAEAAPLRRSFPRVEFISTKGMTMADGYNEWKEHV